MRLSTSKLNIQTNNGCVIQSFNTTLKDRWFFPLTLPGSPPTYRIIPRPFPHSITSPTLTQLQFLLGPEGYLSTSSVTSTSEPSSTLIKIEPSLKRISYILLFLSSKSPNLPFFLCFMNYGVKRNYSITVWMFSTGFCSNDFLYDTLMLKLFFFPWYKVWSSNRLINLTHLRI